MANESPGTGLFGVRGFGLYERWNSWVNDSNEEEGKPRTLFRDNQFNQFRGPGADFPSAGSRGGTLEAAGLVSVVARCRPPSKQREPCYDLVAEETGPFQPIRLRLQAPEVGLQEVSCTAYLGPDSTQEAVFEHAAHIVERTVDGCSGLVLCCGPRSSGKTYTMVGPVEDIRPFDDLPSDGIIQRAARLIFERMQNMDEVFVVEASFLDICPTDGGGPEQLTDLLSERAARLRVMKDPLKPQAFVCEGLSRVPIRNHEKVGELLKAGIKRRESLEAARGRRQRHPHCVFTLSLESLAVEEGSIEPIVKRGKLVFVEFEGLPSPGLARGSGSLGGDRSPALELLLQDCVRGDSPVLLVANFSPELQRASESVRTLALAECVLLGEGVDGQTGEVPRDEAAELDPAEPQVQEPLVAVPTERELAPATGQPQRQATWGVGQSQLQPTWEEVRSQRREVPAPATSSATARGSSFPRLGRRSPSQPAAVDQRRESVRAGERVEGTGRPLAHALPGVARPRAAQRASTSTAHSVPPRERTLAEPVAESAEEAVLPLPSNAEARWRHRESQARVCALEENLQETEACRRAIDMEVAQLKVKAASTEERVRMISEHVDELVKERSTQQEERRTLMKQTDMQQQKLILFEEDLSKVRAEAQDKRSSVVELKDAFDKDMESVRQEREAWRVLEGELQQKVSKDRRELEEFKRRTSLERLREKTRADEAVLQLRVQLRRLQDESEQETTQLEEAHARVAVLQAEVQVAEQREEALKQEGMRKLLMKKQELDEVKASEHQLQNMLAELQDGLLAEDGGTQEGKAVRA